MRKVLAILTGLLGVLALFFRGQAQQARAEKVEQDAKLAENAQNTTQKATEALVKGVTHEQDVSNPRDYDFRD